VRRLLPIGGRNLRVRLCQLGSVTLWPSPPWFLHSGSLHTLLFLVCVCVCTELDSACSGNWLTWFCVLTLELVFFLTNIYIFHFYNILVIYCLSL
jgi:hypothetical protein